MLKTLFQFSILKHWKEIKIAKLLIVAIVIGFLTEFLLFITDDNYHLKLMNGFYCHLFGSIAGVLVGLKVFSHRNAKSELAHIIIGNIGISIFLVMMIVFILLNVCLFFLD